MLFARSLCLSVFGCLFCILSLLQVTKPKKIFPLWADSSRVTHFPFPDSFSLSTGSKKWSGLKPDERQLKQQCILFCAIIVIIIILFMLCGFVHSNHSYRLLHSSALSVVCAHIFLFCKHSHSSEDVFVRSFTDAWSSRVRFKFNAFVLHVMGRPPLLQYLLCFFVRLVRYMSQLRAKPSDER